MGEKIKENSMAMFGDRDTNLAYRNTTESWTRADDQNKLVVERCGFVPLKNRVSALVQSGERLLEARREAFVYAEDDEPEEFDVDATLQQDFTELEALQMKKEVEARLKRRANERHNNSNIGDNVSDISTAENGMISKENKENVKEVDDVK